MEQQSLEVGPVIKTRDVAYTYRMNAGSPGQVTRMHPAAIWPRLNDPSSGNPLTYFGQAALFDASTNTVRAVNHTADSALGGTSVPLAGVTVRPFPYQDSGSGENYGGAAFGGGGPIAGAEVDLLQGANAGILVTQGQPTAGATASALGGVVYVRVTVGAGAFAALPVGGFETVVDTTAANQLTVSNAYWNGPADPTGVAELIFK
jgi:hypothetical protein